VKKIVRRLAREELPGNVVRLRGSATDTIRKQLLANAIEYCTARCGGCELTRQVSPPV
jgi:hypothetical protein